MIRKSVYAALLAGSAFAYSTAAVAQEAPAAEQPEPTEPDPSDATADQAIAEAQPVDDMQAKIELLQAQVEALQEALEGVKAAQVKVTPSWKGAPQLEDKEAGWSFKPRGRIQYDVGYVSNPDDNELVGGSTASGQASTPATWASTPAPAASGLAPKAPSRAASATSAKWTSPTPRVGFGDVILTYTPTKSPFNIAIGNQETNNGLEQISSSRWSSFVERAAFDDAFINTRRIGINLGYANKANTIRLNAGLWAAHSIDSSPRQRRLDRRRARGLRATDGRQPAALRRQFPAPRVPVEQQRHDRLRASARLRPTRSLAIAPGRSRS